MLMGIDPRLGADVLRALRAMGHGDVVVLCDANFPAEAVARDTVVGRPLRIDGTLPEAAGAVLSVLPLDTFVEDFAGRMAVVGDPDAVPDVQRAVADLVAATGEARPMVAIERFAFYDAARAAFAVIRTGERRFYGCVLFRKGVIGPDA